MKTMKRIWLLATAVIYTALLCFSTVHGGGEPVRLDQPRLHPLTDSELSDRQQELLAPRKDAIFQNILRTLIRHPKLFEKWEPFASYIFDKSTLPPRDREILMLRIGWLYRSAYEFGQHAIIGKRIGLKDEEILRIMEGPDAPGWDPFDVNLLRAVDELHRDAFITDSTWNALAKRYSEEQLFDVIFTVGEYSLVCMFLNSLGVQLDAGVPNWFPRHKEK
jgi:alkylhydroperoxidase family enzyme